MLCEDFQIFTSILISINRQTECQESGKSVQTLTLQKRNQDGVKINGKTCGLRQAVSGWIVVNVIRYFDFRFTMFRECRQAF